MINETTKFLGVDSTKVDLTERKDLNNNSKTEYYSLDEIRGYKVYTALLTQSGTNAPVATVLENTLGFDITWLRSGAGQYYSFSLQGQNRNKTVLFAGNYYDQYTSFVSFFVGYDANPTEVDGIYLLHGEAGDSLFDSFEYLPVEIRVYN